ncbi:hypothetical protein PhCBS80983_g06497 [Powellomyces hirtus]|uniref:Reverse transcriptase domain-containing protein n=1 Tax=Powellomyces hirtus TaxID=109895 RepID=A0A507DLK1_9FUNG|nr:hypothetical protein PhCBS80983_g06497 [Powellomyces hirtus]
MTHKDATPLPNLSELRDRLVNMRIFTAINIRNAYHCIMIRPEDREKTAFRTHFGNFKYNILPFGLTNAPATFQRLTNKLLGDKYDAYVISYLDDILIVSTDMSLHTQHVDEVLKTLAEHHLHIKPSKYQWAVDEVEFCGHRVSKDDLKLLGLVKSIRANRHYLIGRPFCAFADHKSLIYLQEQPHLSRRQAGWVEFLQQFDFSVEYLPGTWNSIADSLSRDPTYALKCAPCQAKIDVVTAIVQLEITATTHMPTDAD